MQLFSVFRVCDGTGKTNQSSIENASIEKEKAEPAANFFSEQN